ncbi:MAG TPA: cytochrome c [Chlorobaculum sp.]|jgi:photosystem P840 reaction center cytochrome c551|uniref:Cytochrome c n=1 Tax=Chlorobaculum tepidum (strain ATCC 49652 / DSM 12025 / NBRC 103806 / TLS) TaxID=194439 RepID=CY551_CHLTE|nr:photosystem P840 reaction-center cytochrome c-551 [Chlorobaculum tepidum]O07091.1 RecName: Full=Cytochrome c; AltName: Full=Cytochrome c-z; Short=Cyt c-z; AltName: Full=Photosystem P840 reaction center cytochrome c-551 [Chlorobaculum tepidum TLS]7UEA_C Chain C, Cytochrome c [Chlorobaculum tepidum TLS]7UEA_c Chain c, Cytochrome c [Chlorobaculum tepidum TLS]7UEB_C Chain C, Cytochrome c [Chlorobaculum tepidum TLS]7UEB_c Chain c, Cytochrome c [Chlorobaculum tepidum TLS]7Z6Q_C Chain C, Cytochro
MDKNSNGKLIALAVGGAVLMGALFFSVSFLTGYIPAPNHSAILTPLRSFMGWFLLIFCASIIIMGLGKMSSAISDKWFLSFPLSIFVIVMVMFLSLRVYWEKGRTTTVDGKYIRTTAELKEFLNKPAATSDVPPAPAGFDFDAAKKLVDVRCNKCHTLDSVADLFRTKYKKTGQVNLIVKRMQGFPGSGISDDDAKTIGIWLHEKF